MTTNDPIERSEYQWLWYRDKRAEHVELRSLKMHRRNPKRKMFHPVRGNAKAFKWVRFGIFIEFAKPRFRLRLSFRSIKNI